MHTNSEQPEKENISTENTLYNWKQQITAKIQYFYNVIYIFKKPEMYLPTTCFCCSVTVIIDGGILWAGHDNAGK